MDVSYEVEGTLSTKWIKTSQVDGILHTSILQPLPLWRLKLDGSPRIVRLAIDMRSSMNVRGLSHFRPGLTTRAVLCFALQAVLMPQQLPFYHTK
jgi:hypothetical protein